MHFNLIDTHSHINMMIKKEFDVALPHNFSILADPVIQEAAACNVNTLINVGTSLIESINCVTLAKHYKNCFATLGIHPNDITHNWQHDIAEFKKLLDNKKENKIVGIGEIGLDYHYENYNKELQYQVLKVQIELALSYNLPIIIHTRDAGLEVLQVLEQYKGPDLRGIIHCFSEDQQFADYALSLGFLLGIGGPITYPKNQALRDIFTNVPLEKIVLETDAPFLPPQAIRGKQNSPAHIATVAHYLATLRGINVETVANITTQTTQALFNI